MSDYILLKILTVLLDTVPIVIINIKLYSIAEASVAIYSGTSNKGHSE